MSGFGLRSVYDSILTVTKGGSLHVLSDVINRTVKFLWDEPPEPNEGSNISLSYPSGD